jgi:sec-independent protein translocase protein TatC
MDNQEQIPSVISDLRPHLVELRSRLLKALIALIISTLISFSIANHLIEILTRPIGGIQSLQSIEVTENVGVFMRVSLLSGFTLSFPIVLYQVLAFVLPGLNEKEKHWLKLLMPLATSLFLAGVIFAYFVMLPAALPFLISFAGIQTIPRPMNYINFVTSLLFWIGVGFEMPLVIFMMAKLGLVTAGGLTRQWRIAIVLIAILAAVITPTIDPVNMGLLMLPLVSLYLLSILLALFARPLKK